jgi:hypothetical protein
MEDDERKERETTPENSLDLTLMFTNSEWGKDRAIPEDLKNTLTKKFFYMDKDGKTQTIDRSSWGLLGFFTRDFRLGNLDSTGVKFCEHYSELAAELLDLGFTDPFIICLSRVAGKIEISQSKGGFFRKQSSTITQERISRGVEPTTKGLFKPNTKKSNGY